MSNTNLRTQSSSVLQNDTVSSCSISKVQEKTQLSRIKCMNSLRAIQSQLKFLIETLQDFGNMPIFKRTFSQDLDLLENHLTKEIISQTDCKTTLTKLKTTFENAFSSEIKARMQNYTRYDAQSFYDAMIFNMDSLGKYMLELILHQQRTPQLLKQKKLMQTQEDHSNPIPALNVDSLKVDLVVIQNTCSEKEDSNSETASSKLVKECSLNFETKDVHAIKYKMSKAKERCMAYFRSLHSHLQVLSKGDSKGTRIEHGFKREFMSLFGQDVDTFTSTMLLNIDQLQKQHDKDEFQEAGSMTAFWVVQHFRDTLLQHLGNVKKSVAERTRHQRQTDSTVQDDNNRSGNDTDANDADIRPIYDEEPMAEVQLTAECNIFAIGQQHTEQPEIINEGRVDQMEAHCIALELKYQNQALKSGQHGQILNETSNKAKIEKEIDVLETMNIELEHSVAKLRKENETLKQHYKDLYDSIKITRSKTTEQTTSLLANNAELKAQIQEKVFAIAALKNDLRKLKGNSVDTKFDKTSVLGKPVLPSLRNQSVVRQPNAFKSERAQMSKQRFASQVDVNKNLSKLVTQYYLAMKTESAFAKPDHMIASSSSRNSSKNMPRFSSNDMVHNHYLDVAKKKIQERGRNSTSSLTTSARIQTTTDDSKPKPSSNNQTSRSLPVYKSSRVMITVVPKADYSKSSSFFSDSKQFVCSTCHKCVFNANHDACITKLLKEIFTGHRFSPNKTSAVYEKTSPRSDLRWKTTGRIFKSVGLRWIPTGKLFDSCTSKVDSEPPHGSNVDIPNIHECKQTLDVSAGTSINVQKEQSLDLSAGRFILRLRYDTNGSHPAMPHALSDPQLHEHGGSSGAGSQDGNIAPFTLGFAPPVMPLQLEYVVLKEKYVEQYRQPISYNRTDSLLSSFGFESLKIVHDGLNNIDEDLRKIAGVQDNVKENIPTFYQAKILSNNILSATANGGMNKVLYVNLDQISVLHNLQVTYHISSAITATNLTFVSNTFMRQLSSNHGNNKPWVNNPESSLTDLLPSLSDTASHKSSGQLLSSRQMGMIDQMHMLISSEEFNPSVGSGYAALESPLRFGPLMEVSNVGHEEYYSKMQKEIPSVKGKEDN
ncbi:hypothetical protein Tco_0345207 [Tanacetum coccineum]